MPSMLNYLDFTEEQYNIKKKTRREKIYTRTFANLEFTERYKVTVLMLSGLLRYWKGLFVLLGCYSTQITSHVDVSRKPIGPILKGQAFRQSSSSDCLILVEGKHRFSRNVRDYQSALRNIPEAGRSQIIACMQGVLEGGMCQTSAECSLR